MRARYDEELLGVDRLIGQLVEELKDRDLYDDTLILVTADHGEEFGEHGGYFHGHSLHDELLRVPLVWKPPASWEAPTRPDGRRHSSSSATSPPPSSTPPACAQLPAGTHTLLPWIRGERRDAPNRYVVSEGVDQVALNEGRWKMIVGREGRAARPGFELYDLQKDPGEKRNLAEGKRTRLALMRQLLGELAQGPPSGATEGVVVDRETHDGLDALGYVGQGGARDDLATPTPAAVAAPATAADARPRSSAAQARTGRLVARRSRRGRQVFGPDVEHQVRVGRPGRRAGAAAARRSGRRRGRR